MYSLELVKDRDNMVSEHSIRGELKQVIVLCERVLDQLASLKSSAAAVATEELDADNDAATIDSTKLATAMPPTCSTSWSNHDVEVLTPVSGAMSSSPLPEGTSALVPKSAAPHATSSSARVVDAALDIVLSTAISCTSMPTKCSMPGLEPNASDGHDAATSLATRAASMIISVPAGLPTISARRASATIKLDTVVHAKCSMECHDEYDVKLLLPATVSVLTPVQVWLPQAVKPKLSTNGMLGAVPGDLAMTTHVTNSRHCSVYCLWDQATRPPPRPPGQTPTTSCLPHGRANPEPPPPPWPSLHEKTPHSPNLHVDNRKQSLNVDNKVSYQVFHEWPPDRASIEDVGVTIQIVNEMPHDRGERLSSSGTTGLQQPWPPPSQYFSTILSLSNHCVGTQQEFVLWELNPWIPPVREDRSSRIEVSFLQSQPCFMKNDGGMRLLPPWPSDQAIGVKCMVVEMGMSPENPTHRVLLLHQPWPPPTQMSVVKMSYSAPLQIVELKQWSPPERANFHCMSLRVEISLEHLGASSMRSIECKPWPPHACARRVVLLQPCLLPACASFKALLRIIELKSRPPPVCSRTIVMFLQSWPFSVNNDSGRLLPPWPQDQAIGAKSMLVEMRIWPKNCNNDALLSPRTPSIQWHMIKFSKFAEWDMYRCSLKTICEQKSIGFLVDNVVVDAMETLISLRESHKFFPCYYVILKLNEANTLVEKQQMVIYLKLKTSCIDKRMTSSGMYVVEHGLFPYCQQEADKILCLVVLTPVEHVQHVNCLQLSEGTLVIGNNSALVIYKDLQATWYPGSQKLIRYEVPLQKFWLCYCGVSLSNNNHTTYWSCYVVHGVSITSERAKPMDL